MGRQRRQHGPSVIPAQVGIPGRLRARRKARPGLAPTSFPRKRESRPQPHPLSPFPRRQESTVDSAHAARPDPASPLRHSRASGNPGEGASSRPAAPSTCRIIAQPGAHLRKPEAAKTRRGSQDAYHLAGEARERLWSWGRGYEGRRRSAPLRLASGEKRVSARSDPHGHRQAAGDKQKVRRI